MWVRARIPGYGLNLTARSMLLIDSFGAIWAWWSKQFNEPKCASRHVCWVTAWIRHQGLVPYVGFEKVLNPKKSRDLCLFFFASHQTRLDTWSKSRRPIKFGIKGRGRSGTSRDSNPAFPCCLSTHLVQLEPDEASSFTNPNVGSGTYAGLWLELDTKV